MKKYIYILSTIILAVMYSGCSESLEIEGDDIRNNILEPKITTFYPTSGAPGTAITIEGENLSSIDTVYIGGELAKIKNRITNEMILIEVTANAKSGKIEISNPKGKTISATDFNIIVTIPVINRITTLVAGEIFTGEDVLVSGENLLSISAITIGGQTAAITLASDTELHFTVPMISGITSSKIQFRYTDNGTTKTVESNDSYTIKSPSIISCPTTANAGETITITGTNLDMMNHAMLGSNQLSFVSQTSTEIKLKIPASYTVETIAKLILVYNSTKEYLAVESFVITVPSDALVYYWENKTIYAQDPSTQENFFDAISGKIYTPCEYETVKNNIYFFITNSSSSIQLNNPNNSGNQTKNFKCNNVVLPTETMPNIVKFRALSSSVPAEQVYIEQVKNKTLKSVSAQEITDAGIAHATTSAPRFKGIGVADNAMNPGDILLMQQYNSSGEVIKVGFIEIVKFTTNDPATDKTSAMTFNCYLSK